MIWLAITILCLSAFLNYRVGGKTALYPPLVFCLIWSFDLFILWLAGNFFYPMRAETIFLFICGALLFSLGGWFAFGWGHPKTALASTPKSAQRIITGLVVVLICILPLYYWWLYSITEHIQAMSFFAATRRVTIEQRGTLAFSLFGNLLDLSVLVALLAVYERDGHKKRAFWAVIVATMMCLLMGAKIYTVGLLLSLFCTDALKTRRLRWRVAVVIGLAVVAIASVLFYLVTGFNGYAITGLKDLFALYTSGSMVGFDRVLRDPGIIPHDSDSFTVLITRILSRLGIIHEAINYEGYDFLDIGPFMLQGNVYTMYFRFMDWGYAGMIAVAGMLGFGLAAIYRKALLGSRMCVLLYASLFPGLVLTPFDDDSIVPFLWFKVCAVAWLVYSFPHRLRQFRTMFSASAAGAASQFNNTLAPRQPTGKSPVA